MAQIFSKTQTRFEYTKRKKQGCLVLIPGWASDHRIFDTLDLDYDYLVPVEFSPFDFKQALLQAIKDHNIKSISLFGWSLGGFIAAEFASQHPDLIDELVLASIRKKYKAEDLKEIKDLLSKNKKGFLYKFYLQSFYSKEDMAWFKENLLKDYCQNLDLDYLIRTLDYLGSCEIRPELLHDLKRIRIIHGEDDLIAPLQEAIDIKSGLTEAEFISMKETGHIPFLKEDFKLDLYNE